MVLTTPSTPPAPSTAIASTSPGASAPRALNRRSAPERGRRFTSLLTKATQAAGEARGLDDPERAREAAQKLVSSALVLPLLRQIHNNPLKTKLFHGGVGEEKFNQQLDTILADRITGSAHWPIVDAVVKRVTRGRAHGAGGVGAVEGAGGAGADASVSRASEATGPRRGPAMNNLLSIAAPGTELDRHG